MVKLPYSKNTQIEFLRQIFATPIVIISVPDPIYKEVLIPKQIWELGEISLLKERRIHQLGDTRLSNPKATHLRKEHCCGVFKITLQRLIKIHSLLKKQKLEHLIPVEDYIVALINAYIHDFGHGDSSHSGEYVIGRYDIQDIMLIRLLLESEEMKKALKGFGGKVYEKVLTYFKPKKNGYPIPSTLQNLLDSIDTNISIVSVLQDVLVNSIDDDRIDYLLRDSYYLGYHVTFDVCKLIKSMKLTINNGRVYIGYSESTLADVQNSLFMRFDMYKDEYINGKNTKPEIFQKAIYSYLLELGVSSKWVEYNRGCFNQTISVDNFFEHTEEMTLEELQSYTNSKDEFLSVLVNEFFGNKKRYVFIDTGNEVFLQELKQLLPDYPSVLVISDKRTRKLLSDDKPTYMVMDDGTVRDITDDCSYFIKENISVEINVLYVNFEMLISLYPDKANEIRRLMNRYFVSKNKQVEIKFTCEATDFERVSEEIVELFRINSHYKVIKAQELCILDRYFDNKCKLLDSQSSIRLRESISKEGVENRLTIKKPSTLVHVREKFNHFVENGIDISECHELIGQHFSDINPLELVHEVSIQNQREEITICDGFAKFKITIDNITCLDNDSRELGKKYSVEIKLDTHGGEVNLLVLSEYVQNNVAGLVLNYESNYATAMRLKSQK